MTAQVKTGVDILVNVGILVSGFKYLMDIGGHDLSLSPPFNLMEASKTGQGKSNKKHQKANRPRKAAL